MNSFHGIVQKTKRKLISYQQGELPNIALVATIRGGSTLVADMIAAQRGMWFSNEPFAPCRRNFLGQQLQQLSQGYANRSCRFFDLNALQQDEIHHYMEQLNHAMLLTGTARRAHFPLRADRVCLKLLRAQWLTDMFAAQGMQILFVLRHPAAQALSVIRLGWKPSAEIYFEKPDFLQKYFSDDQLEYGLALLAEGSAFQKAVLSWVCDIIYPLRYSQQVSYQFFYEELIAEPEQSISHLCKVLHLSDANIMGKILSQPSGSSKLCTNDINQAITVGDSRLLLQKWCGQVDESDRKAGQEILDRFDISCYNMYDIMPNATKTQKQERRNPQFIN